MTSRTPEGKFGGVVAKQTFNCCVVEATEDTHHSPLIRASSASAEAQKCIDRDRAVEVDASAAFLELKRFLKGSPTTLKPGGKVKRKEKAVISSPPQAHPSHEPLPPSCLGGGGDDFLIIPGP